MQTQPDWIDIYTRAKRAGIPLYHICRRAGVHQTTPSRWGKSAPRKATLAKMFDALAQLEKEKPHDR